MKVYKNLFLFFVGGAAYITIEWIWHLFRGGSTHWTMFILGGLCFLLIGRLNENISWDMPFWKQCLIGDGIVLSMEFIFGVVLNLLLKMNIWDYSGLPFNILGQVCLPFAVAWFFLAAFAIVLDDYLRYWLFGEEKPHYHWI